VGSPARTRKGAGLLKEISSRKGNTFGGKSPSAGLATIKEGDGAMGCEGLGTMGDVWSKWGGDRITCFFQPEETTVLPLAMVLQ